MPVEVIKEIVNNPLDVENLGDRRTMAYNANFEDTYHNSDLKDLNYDDDFLGDLGVTTAGTSEVTLSVGWIHRWTSEIMKLLQKGEYIKMLHYLGLCLDDTFRAQVVQSAIASGSPDQPEGGKYSLEMLSDPALILAADQEVNLLEKRCLVYMKLQMYDKVWEESRRILEKKSNHSVALKCLLAALCKLNKLDQVPEVLKLWKKTSPSDLDMLECRTKLEGLMDAVTNGIEPKQAFSNVEDLLRLNYDWLLGKKSFDDSQWHYRPLPPGANSFVLCLQYRFGHCNLGERCPDAHGEQELAEWKLRHSTTNMTELFDAIKLDTGSSYVKSIMDELSRLDDERSILAEELAGSAMVTCLEPLKILVHSCGGDSHIWKFNIESKHELHHVCLLYEVHRPYFYISSAHFQGSSNPVNLLSGTKHNGTTLQYLDIHVSPTAKTLAGSTSGFSYSVEISFTPQVFGMFRQTVVFDFNSNPKLVRHLIAEVSPPPERETDSQATSTDDRKLLSGLKNELGSSIRSKGTWNFGNAEIVDSVTGERVPSTKVGFALMNGGTNAISTKGDLPFETRDLTLTKENYKERMRFFLTQEERARQEILSKYNVSAILTMSGKYDIKGGYNDGMTRYAVDGALFARMTLFRDVSEDTAVGRLILRSCNCILLTKSEEARRCSETGEKPRVYLCWIADKTKNAMYIDIGATCAKELDLQDSCVAACDVQFQLDRTAFTQQKNVIDQINETHLNLLFPSFTGDMRIPWTPMMQWNSDVETEKFRLNPKQKEALIAVTSETYIPAPILIIGPFGTGKTFTLAQCIRKMLFQEGNRIIICTHSNSAADLYIKEYLHPMVVEGVEAARPLRIYYEERSLKTVHPNVLKYCLIENLVFRRPTREEVLKHQVIVVTLSTSYALMGLELPADAFSHILLDEAAQAMESEAITPLMVAGEKTRLVLAGDHMQLSPELFSEHAKNFHPSLLERLHYSYPDHHPCKLMLCENYRSHAAIIQFASESFYQKKLECGISQPVHNKFYPLTFFVARGEDVQEPDSTSYYNMAEVCEVADKVAELISSWPEKWGNWRHESAIGVLTPYPDQVVHIRARLRQKGLHNVSVERVMNVQGKQFRAVFLSTVRTHKPWVHILPTAVGNEVDLGFFSNPKLLNTALTRAQSLVAVVGDPVSLCSLGKCRRLWEDFIRICHENKSLFGISFSQLKQNILGVELRLTWGLNPLANEFEPQPKFVRARSKFAETVLKQLENEENLIASGSRDNHLVARSQQRHAQMMAPPTAPTFNQCPKGAPGIFGKGVFIPPPQTLANSQVPHQQQFAPRNQPMAQMAPNPLVLGAGYGIHGSGPPLMPHPPFVQPMLRKASPGTGRLERALSNPSLANNPYNPGFNPYHQSYQMGLNPGMANMMQPPFIPAGRAMLPSSSQHGLYQPAQVNNLYASGPPLMQMNHPGGYLVPINPLQKQQMQQQQLLLQQHRLPHPQTHSQASAFAPYLPPNHQATTRQQLHNPQNQPPPQPPPVKFVPRPFITSPGAFPPLPTVAEPKASVASSMAQGLGQSRPTGVWNQTYGAALKAPPPPDPFHSPPQSNQMNMTGSSDFASGTPLYRQQQNKPEQHQPNPTEAWTNALEQQQHQLMLQKQQQQFSHQLQQQTSIQLRPGGLPEPGAYQFTPEEIAYMKQVLELYSSTTTAGMPTTTGIPQPQQEVNQGDQRNSTPQSGIMGAYGLNSHGINQAQFHQNQAPAQNPSIYRGIPPGGNGTWNGTGDTQEFDYLNPGRPSSSLSGGIWNGNSGPPGIMTTTASTSMFMREMGMSENFGNSQGGSPGAAGRSYASAVKQQQQQQGNQAIAKPNAIKRPQPLLLAERVSIPPLFPEGVTFNSKPSGSGVPLSTNIGPIKRGRKKNGKKE